MTEGSVPFGGETQKIRLTQHQRYVGFVIIAGIAVYAVVGVVTYSQFLIGGPAIPSKDALARIEGQLAGVKRHGGKSKQKALLLKVGGHSERLDYDTNAQDVERVEQQLESTAGNIAVLYDSADGAVYEIHRGETTIRSYEETLPKYTARLSTQAHVKGIIAFVLFVSTVAMFIGLHRMPLPSHR